MMPVEVRGLGQHPHLHQRINQRRWELLADWSSWLKGQHGCLNTKIYLIYVNKEKELKEDFNLWDSQDTMKQGLPDRGLRPLGGDRETKRAMMTRGFTKIFLHFALLGIGRFLIMGPSLLNSSPKYGCDRNKKHQICRVYLPLSSTSAIFVSMLCMNTQPHFIHIPLTSPTQSLLCHFKGNLSWPISDKHPLIASLQSGYCISDTVIAWPICCYKASIWGDTGNV